MSAENINHLEELLKFVEGHEDYEYHFEKLFKRLQTEYYREMQKNSDLRTNHYLNNLRQTIEKQAAAYQKAKARKKNCWSEFSDFTRHFKQDISEELNLYRYRTEPSAPPKLESD